MTGRVALVTGGSCGIGYHTAWYLAEGGNDVVIACHDLEKGKAAVQGIKQDLPNALVQCMQMDLSSQSSVRQFVEEFCRKKTKISVLVNNAAICLRFNDLTRRTTSDGVELTLATNYIGPYLLTYLLIDYLVQAGSLLGDSRIINVACSQHHYKKPGKRRNRLIEQESIDLLRDESYSGGEAYATSKLYLIMFGYYLSKKLQGKNVCVHTVDPGSCPATCLLRHHSKLKQFWSRVCLSMILKSCVGATQSVKRAAQFVVEAAISDKYQGRSGKYWVMGHDERSALQTYDTDTQRELWRATLNLLGIHGSLTLNDSQDSLDNITTK